MGNMLRGECELHIGDKVFVLVFDQNAICEMEEVLKEPFSRCAARWSNDEFAFREIRAMLWAGTRRRHSRLTLHQCGDLMGSSDIKGLIETMMPAFNKAFPKPEEAEKEMSDEGNETADVGTGTPS